MLTGIRALFALPKVPNIIHTLIEDRSQITTQQSLTLASVAAGGYYFYTRYYYPVRFWEQDIYLALRLFKGKDYADFHSVYFGLRYGSENIGRELLKNYKLNYIKESMEVVQKKLELITKLFHYEIYAKMEPDQQTAALVTLYEALDERLLQIADELNAFVQYDHYALFHREEDFYHFDTVIGTDRIDNVLSEVSEHEDTLDELVEAVVDVDDETLNAIVHMRVGVGKAFELVNRPPNFHITGPEGLDIKQMAVSKILSSGPML